MARSDSDWMLVALEEADLAASHSDVPIGAVIVDAAGNELSRGHNERELSKDPTAHAEVVAIRRAAERMGSWRLEGATLYVTLEPCVMCAGALVLSRMRRVVYGCDDPKAGALVSLYAIGGDLRLNHRFATVPGVRADECASRLRAFFAALRALGKK
ncbi:nucleoside deaminase [bacterium]|nr:MAG: nucleoside deaminase [bacterium]